MPILLKEKGFMLIVIGFGLPIILIQLWSLEKTHIPFAILIAILAGILEIFPIELRNGKKLSCSSIFNIVVLVQMGISEAVIVVFIASLFLFYNSKLSFISWLFQASQCAVAVFLSGFVFEYFFGKLGVFTYITSVFAFACTTFIYFFIFFAITMIYKSLVFSQNFSDVLKTEMNDTLLAFAVTFILGFRLAAIDYDQQPFPFWFETIFAVAVFLFARSIAQVLVRHRKNHLTTLENITQYMEQKVHLPKGHSKRVGDLARRIAEELKLSPKHVDAVHYAALLHDIGKIQMEHEIFQKRGALTLEEEKLYKQHSELGAKMVSAISGIEKAAQYVRFHHEQWDGKGYPDGKKGEEIPLGARIIAAANEYDKLMHSSGIINQKKAFQNLKNTKLDPKLVEIVLKIADFKKAGKDHHPGLIQAQNQQHFHDIKYKGSKLLKDFSVVQAVFYQNGSFYHINGEKVQIPCEQQIKSLITNHPIQNGYAHEFIEDVPSRKMYNVHWICLEKKILCLLFDVSHLREYERKQELRIRTIYRDCLYAVTQGKLTLIEREELKSFNQGEKIAEFPVSEKNDVAACRTFIDQLLKDRHISEKKRYNVLLSISEAVTNVLKHAVEGKMKVYLNHDWLKVIVEDKGNGIKLSELPKSILLEGYSSKRSFGHGFSIMLKMMDKISIYTSTEGTTIILEVDLKDRLIERRKNIPL
ncbi:HD domain-containing phosphohydrolase [Aeribacillus pallidus]|jgi:putative nucleotidyltransferase with HDIG domain|uniref:HD-GYP domain-containing protein n=1 Tax=Aeribacillus pallidus TaxID=33936 RepID=A0A165WAV5_9BACI|nr:HD domain-containing phosphohydrolase [Aeribacillus pallidus]KZN94821.1 hypothetical protein AZI98_17660 [Aeribacillus pallidus]